MLEEIEMNIVELIQIACTVCIIAVVIAIVQGRRGE